MDPPSSRYGTIESSKTSGSLCCLASVVRARRMFPTIYILVNSSFIIRYALADEVGEQSQNFSERLADWCEAARHDV